MLFGCFRVEGLKGLEFRSLTVEERAELGDVRHFSSAELYAQTV